jgi:hypothetical protein
MVEGVEHIARTERKSLDASLNLGEYAYFKTFQLWLAGWADHR